MSLNDAIVSLYKNNKLEKSEAYELLSQVKALSRNNAAPVPERLVVECALPGSTAERLALWCYFVSILENQGTVSVSYIEGDSRKPLLVSVQEDMTFQELIEQVSGTQQPGEAGNDDPKYLFVNDSRVDTGIAKAVCTVKQELVEFQAEQDPRRKTRFEEWPEFFQFVLPQMQAHPELPLNQLDLLPPSHKIRLENYNRTYGYLPEQRTLGSLLLPSIQRYRTEVAVEMSGASLSYDELQTQACALANLLRQVGVKPNTLVPVLCQRSVQMPAALLGIVYSGGAYVPLEPDNPADRIEGILQQTQAEVIVTDRQTLATAGWRLGDTHVKTIVCLDEYDAAEEQGIQVLDARQLRQQSTECPADVNQPDDLCYVIFTSGSTGKPKGVMISHLNIVNTAIGVNNQYRVNAADRVMCFSSYSFDLSVWDIFGSFLAGARVFVPTKAQIKDPAGLIDIIDQHRITIWDSVPTGMSQMLIPLLDRNDQRTHPTLRLAMLSGEFIPLSLPANIHRYFPNCKISSLGGATEGTVWSIFYYPVDRVAPHWKSIPYGFPLANQRFYVLNEAMKPCAIGQKGMLYIAGLGVAQGYYGDEEKTRNAFIPCPWESDMGETIYKTGDLGVLNADGVVEIVGRADYQVKVRGFRVELGEVETQLSGIHGIDQAAVLARPDPMSGNRLVAFYTSASGELSAGELQQALKGKLPEYMVPSQFVFLANPPVGTTGKLDRKALMEWQVSRTELSQTFVPPSTDEEHRLADSLKAMLNIDRIGVEDDFFLIGGDSLLALQYISALKNMGYSATPAIIMEGRTIREILQRVKDGQGQPSPSLSQQQPHSALSPMQYKFIHRMPLVNRDHWNQSIELRMQAVPEIERLNTALNKVIAAHPMLHAGIDQDNTERLAVADIVTRPIIVHDLSTIEPEVAESEYQRLIAELQSHRSCRAQGIGDMMLGIFSDQDVRLIWSVNHFSVDAHCWRILVEDLAAAYQQPQQPLPATAPFSDYVDTVKQGFGEARQQYAADWNQFAESEQFRLPKDLEGSNLEADLCSYAIQFSEDQTRGILDCVSSAAGVNLHLVTLTSVMQALHQWSGEQQVALDVISNGRDIHRDKDFSRTIGWFATHNPFAASISNDIHETLTQVSQNWQAHQQSSRYFVEACNQAHADPKHALYGYQDNAVLYNFLGMYDNLALPSGWQVRGSAGQDRASENPRTHELELEILVVGGRLNIQIHYSGKQYQATTVEGLGKAIQSGISALTGG
ncbi:amino acid adenylation domain-containing protein [Gynuella sunshinyii]|uniref:Non-ribosomal peptide synthetase modules-related protein n=1 Tax=Gynuella sunshinyii YC6258 TaxID=1445510 RepID=A0A0C5W325_9GAMM|nr:amino acid adenylation domain-containing protein [Gynuella sunshinyii]AJQ97069.1 non-ribosomal peptide synthetase modules-related protein [Gynuella sunshinyii YC6258]